MPFRRWEGRGVAVFLQREIFWDDTPEFDYNEAARCGEASLLSDGVVMVSGGERNI
ncbi:hypothetical protein [Brenneria roseae]|uniref:hypothetical protein n=1 Tax=Brenneria roseae TaxID=1509241 RepID=UPI0014736E69|nr:hypothetical protein [Brenneria roseae]